jgi:2-iminobutanoate/2-iminopropanoate deaminase
MLNCAESFETMSDIEFLVAEKTGDNALPISRATVAGDFMYTWGDGVVMRPGHVKEDMRELFERLKALLGEKGLTFADVAKVTALLSDQKLWPEYTEVYKEYFKEPYPVRTTIPFPADEAILEIDLVAFKRGLSDR